jgi:hypothetical protein
VATTASAGNQVRRNMNPIVAFIIPRASP